MAITMADPADHDGPIRAVTIPEMRTVVELDAEVGEDRRVRLVARTNLPDGTTLMFDLRRDGVDGIDGLLGQSRGAVAGSCVVVGPVGPTAGLEPGRYTARAMVPAVQPPEVAAVLGANLENLRGPDVTRGRFGRSLEAEVTLTVGSEADARSADGDLERERRELRAELDELLAAGRAMEPLRREYRSGSLEGARACGDRMRALQARQRAAEERSEALHARSIYAPFGMLWECVSCSEHASEACAIVERERRAYDRGD